MKKHIITLSKNFLINHPKKGQPTSFAALYLAGKKRHTIREGYDYWKAKIDEVNAGLAQFEVRQWIGKPYATKQITIDILYKGQVGIQPLNLTVAYFGKTKGILAYVKLEDFESRLIDAKQLAKNDGLELQDFFDWFQKPLENPCIIHFTDLRY